LREKGLILIRKSFAIGIAFLAIFILVSLDLIIATYSYPLVEGWWELLAIESSRKLLYKDLYFALPPLYINVLSLLQSFNLNIFEVRLFFIIIHVLEFLTLTYFITRFFKYYIGILAVFVSEILIIAYHVAYLPKDYHMLLGLFVSLFLVGGYFISRYKNIYSAIFLGLIAGLLFLVKQNIAAVLFLSVFILIGIGNSSGRHKIRLLSFYLLAVLALLSSYASIFGFEWVNVYLSNDSKGSLFIVLTRIFGDKVFQNFLIIITLFYTYSFLIKRYPSKIFNLYENKICDLALLMTFIILAFFVAKNKNFDFLISIVLAILSINLINSFNQNIANIKILNFSALAIIPLGIIYSNSMTAGFNFVGSQIAVVIFFAIILNFCRQFHRRLLYLFSFIIILIISNNLYEKIYKGNLYQWWGYKIGSIQKSIVTPFLPEMKGMYITEESQAILNSVDFIRKSDPQSSVYFYPNIPYFYKLFNVRLLTKFPILWFDTVPSKFTNEVTNEFNDINPDYVVWLRPPNSAYSGHAALIQRESLMERIDSILLDGIASGRYSIEYVRPVGLITDYREDNFIKTAATMICNKCNEKDLQNYLITGHVIDYSFLSKVVGQESFLSITFSGAANYIDFCYKFQPLILAPEYPVFMILKRVKN
jgi:hypothetical protein